MPRRSQVKVAEDEINGAARRGEKAFDGCPAVRAGVACSER